MISYTIYNTIIIIIIIIIIITIYIAPPQDCLLRSAPSPASGKHNGLEGREEGDGAINGYLEESDRKPIPGRRASNRKGTALQQSNRAHASMVGLGPQCSAWPKQRLRRLLY